MYSPSRPHKMLTCTISWVLHLQELAGPITALDFPIHLTRKITSDFCTFQGWYHSVYCVGLVVDLVMSSGQLWPMRGWVVGLMTSQGWPQGQHSKLNGMAPGHLWECIHSLSLRPITRQIDGHFHVMMHHSRHSKQSLMRLLTLWECIFILLIFTLGGSK